MSDPWLVAFAIPVVLMIGIVLPRKLIRGRDSPWSWADLFLGLELCWAALGICLIEFYLIAQDFEQSLSTAREAFIRIQANATLTVVTVLAMLVVLTMHQRWEDSLRRVARAWLLGVLCNAVGIALFVAYVVFVKVV